MRKTRQKWFVTETFNKKDFLRASDVADRLGYSKAYLSQIIALAADMTRFRDMTGVFYSKKDVEKVENIIESRGGQLESTDLREMLKGKMRSVSKTHRMNLGVTSYTSRRKIVRDVPQASVVVVIDTKTLLDLVKSGVPVKFEVKN